MAPAYTLYKFKKMFVLVFIFFIGLIVFSQVYPILKEAKNNVLNTLNPESKIQINEDFTGKKGLKEE